MRLPFLFLFLALTGWCVETVLTVDTAQPKALLPYQTFDQGASYDYRVNVKANGTRAALTGADAGVIQFASNGTSVAWAIFTSTSVNTNTGSFLIPMGPLAGPLGDGVYQVYLYNTNTPSRKYSVGGGSFRMEETTGFGSPTASYYLVPLNTDLVEQTGSNRFVRLSELGTDRGDWRLPVYSNQSAIAVLNTGKLDVAVTAEWETGAHLNWLLTVPPLDYLSITNPPWLTTISSQSHAVLSNLTWTASGHSGTPARLAGFFEGGAAGYSAPGAGLYFDGSDNLTVSNDIISGAALGTTAVQTELDLTALAALAANRVTRWYDPADSNKWAEWEGMTNIVVYEVATVPSGTNYSVSYSTGFRYDDGNAVANPSPRTGIDLPYVDGGFTISQSYVGGPVADYVARIEADYPGASSWEAINGTWPQILTSSSLYCFGTATVSRTFSYATNETHRYHFATNAIPPELTNLDLLQAWLNNIYATTSALAAVSTVLGIHTNDAPAHVSAADRAAWYGVTNLPSAGCTALAMTDTTNLVVTGATYAYTADVTNSYWLSIAQTAPSYHYSLTVYGTNDCTLADNMRLLGTKTVTGTNCVSFKPFTNGLWEVLWGGK